MFRVYSDTLLTWCTETTGELLLDCKYSNQVCGLSKQKHKYHLLSLKCQIDAKMLPDIIELSKLLPEASSNL